MEQLISWRAWMGELSGLWGQRPISAEDNPFQWSQPFTYIPFFFGLSLFAPAQTARPLMFVFFFNSWISESMKENEMSWTGPKPITNNAKSRAKWSLKRQAKESISFHSLIQYFNNNLRCAVSVFPFHLFFNCFSFPFQTNKKEISFHNLS